MIIYPKEFMPGDESVEQINANLKAEIVKLKKQIAFLRDLVERYESDD